MKRSAIQRKTPLRAVSPKKRKPKASKAQKDVRWRSEEYLAFVRSLPCMLCNLGPCDAHHVIGLGWGLSGMGLKAADSFAMSLCRTHHTEVHKRPELQRCQPQWLRWTIRKGLEHFGGEIREQLTHALCFIEAKEAV